MPLHSATGRFAPEGRRCVTPLKSGFHDSKQGLIFLDMTENACQLFSTGGGVTCAQCTLKLLELSRSPLR